MTFEEFGLDEKLIEAITYMGYEKPTPIQEAAIPEILKGRDLIAGAQTGTGKTAAFLLPILNKITRRDVHDVNTLVIVPTRELALQIDQQIHGIGYFLPVTSVSIYGGGGTVDWETEKRSLTGGADIIVATPGKLIAHLNMGYVKFETLEHLVLDEADRMLDIGFYDDIMKIVAYLPKKRQTLMFSATMPPKIKELASKILNDPFIISRELAKPPSGVLQGAYLVFENQKSALINSLIEGKPQCKSILIFTSTKSKVGQIVRALKGRGYKVEGISSDLEQQEREEVLLRFRSRQTRVLVATDVMSRGIDIKDIDLVINYDAPHDAEDYVHRVGRTARAESSGIALTLVNPEDMERFHKIENLIGQLVYKIPLPVELGEGPKWEIKPGGSGRGFRRKGAGPGAKNPGKKRH
ncbi:MAG: DEAD/DEAH box helicase [Bacteroidales bacterium]|mgnify:CR=1 FL=1|nr:DEAD/DEAH box helicase [Bacteroidales bacterium]